MWFCHPITKLTINLLCIEFMLYLQNCHLHPYFGLFGRQQLAMSRQRKVSNTAWRRCTQGSMYVSPLVILSGAEEAHKCAQKAIGTIDVTTIPTHMKVSKWMHFIIKSNFNKTCSRSVFSITANNIKLHILRTEIIPLCVEIKEILNRILWFVRTRPGLNEFPRIITQTAKPTGDEW